MKKAETKPIEITVYTADWCQACKIHVPEILQKAENAGLKVNLIDVESNDPEIRKKSSHVEWIPYIEYEGREISREDFLKLTTKQGNSLNCNVRVSSEIGCFIQQTNGIPMNSLEGLKPINFLSREEVTRIQSHLQNYEFPSPRGWAHALWLGFCKDVFEEFNPDKPYNYEELKDLRIALEDLEFPLINVFWKIDAAIYKAKNMKKTHKY